MSALARPTGPAQQPWRRREGEPIEDFLAFVAWREGAIPLDADLAAQWDWSKRANALDALESTPTSAPELLRDGTAYALTAGFIAMRERAIHAAEDPAWARDNISQQDWLATIARASDLTLPDPGREIDWEALLVQGVITREELELRVAADELDRRLGL